MELKDAPVRTSLEMIFKQAGIKSYVIENSVYGVISMNLSDQPFENSLKLVMRANTVPLTYTKENDVYIVKSRRITIEANPDPAFDAGLLLTNKNSSISLRYKYKVFNSLSPDVSKTINPCILIIFIWHICIDRTY